MSNIADIVGSAHGGQVVENLSNLLGLAPWQTEAAIAALIPALSAGLQKAAEDPAVLRRVVAAARDARHRAVFGDAERAGSDATQEGGAEFVDLLFDQPTAGRVAQLAARESNVRADILARLLPILASIVAGGLVDALEKEGKASILGRLAGEEPAAAPAPAPAEEAPPAPEPPAGGIVAFLSDVFSVLFGGGKPAPRASAEPASPVAVENADPLQEALAHIRAAFASGASASADLRAGLDDLLGSRNG